MFSKLRTITISLIATYISIQSSLIAIDYDDFNSIISTNQNISATQYSNDKETNEITLEEISLTKEEINNIFILEETENIDLIQENDSLEISKTIVEIEEDDTNNILESQESLTSDDEDIVVSDEITYENIDIPVIDNDTIEQTEVIKTFSINDIPTYNNSPYYVVNNNLPYFSDNEMTTTVFETYSNLDHLGRCGVATATIGLDLLSNSSNTIATTTPTGWNSVQYKSISSNYLYNICNLISSQLTNNDGNNNFITGTQQLLYNAMLPFENTIINYIKSSENHVYYRVTPIFEGDNLIASGVLLEAKSIEDNGLGVLFNVYCYNIQDNIIIDYSNGNSYSLISDDIIDLSNINSNEQFETEVQVETEIDVDIEVEVEVENDIFEIELESIDELTEDNNSGIYTNNNEIYDTIINNNITSNNTTIIINENYLTSGKFVINTNTKKVHYSSCHYVKQMSSSNKKYSNTDIYELIYQGYSRCKVCKPL